MKTARRLGEYVDRIASGDAVDLDEFLKDTTPEEVAAFRRELKAVEWLNWSEDVARNLHFADFKIERLLGKGGMGAVYVATQISLERKVALKVLPPGLAADFKHVARFYREGQAQGRLQHPNIVGVHTMGVESSTPYIAMELVEGRTLTQVLESFRAGRAEAMPSVSTPFDSLESLSDLFESLDLPLPWTPLPPNAPRFVSPIPGAAHDRPPAPARSAPGLQELTHAYCLWLADAAAGAADGLEHAHGSLVIHRDLKPSNLILDESGRLRILDFGLAWVEGQTQLTGSGPVGTVHYMSPEQFRGEKVLGPATDIYSLGATLYQMLTWRPPFAGSSDAELAYRVVHLDPPRPRGWNRRISRDLETIVLTCLRKDPRERYPSASALAEDLRRFVRGEPVEPPAQPLPLRAARLARRWRWPLVKGAVVLTAAAALAQVLVLGPLEQDRQRRLSTYEEHVRGASASIIEHHLRSAFAGTGRVEARKVPLGEKGEGFQGGTSDFMVVDPESDAALEADNYVFEIGPVASNLERDPVEAALDRLRAAMSLLPGKAIAHVQMARALLIKGNSLEARRHLLRARELEPDSPQGLSLLASLLEDDTTPRARSLLAGIQARLEKLSGDRRAGVRLRAEGAFLDRDWEDAAVAYEWLIASDEGKLEEYPGARLETLLHAGIARLNTVDLAGAIRHFAGGKELWRGGIELVLLLGKLHLLQGDRGKADLLFRQLEEARPDLLQAELRSIAAMYAEAGDFATALRWTSSLGDDLESLRFRAELLRGGGDLDGALASALRARDMARTNVAARLTLADIHRVRGELEEARKECLEADGLAARGDGRPLVALALCLEAMERPAEAESALRSAIERAPGLWPAHYGLARLQVRGGRLEEARASLDAALAADGANALVLNNIGCLLDRTGNRAQAIEAYHAATRAAPLFGPAHYNLAWDLHREQRFAEAASEYRKAEACGVGGDTGLYRNLASCLMSEGELDEAFDLFSKATRFEPRRLLVLHDLARIHVWKGEFEAAHAAYVRALRVGPGSALLREGFGEVLEKLGDVREAITAYGQALEIDPTRTSAQSSRAKLILRSGEPSPRESLATEVVSLEAGARLGGVSRAVHSLLERRRRDLLPDLVSYSSIDWAIEGPDVLIAEGEPWRFHRGKGEPSPGLEWTGLDFDDSGWEQGEGPFGQPATMSVATLLDDMNGSYGTLYLRRAFVVPDEERIRGLVLSVRVDDGFVAYLNGAEVARFRGGKEDARLPSTALAEERDGHDWNVVEFTLDARHLRKGKNVLALQGLNGELESDFVMSPELSATPVLDAARLDGVRPGLQKFEKTAHGPDAPARLAYLEGRLRELEGDAEGARASHEEALRLDAGGVEPRLRLAASLRRSGDSAAAAELIQDAILSGLARDDRLWDAWLEIHFVDLGSAPENLLATLRAPRPGKPVPGGRHAADIHWLLDALARGLPLRIAAAGKAHETAAGEAWSGDRFFRGGEPNYLHRLDERAVPGPLHRTERFFPNGGVDVAAYRIPLPPDIYRIQLHFIEGFHRDDGGHREFDVVLEGTRVLPHFDPGNAGFGVLQEKVYDIEVDDGALDVGFRRRIDLPTIAAIEVKPLGGRAGPLQPSADGGGGGRTRTSGRGLQPAQPVRSR